VPAPGVARVLGPECDDDGSGNHGEGGNPYAAFRPWDTSSLVYGREAPV
jgi:hypothetical protein